MGRKNLKKVVIGIIVLLLLSVLIGSGLVAVAEEKPFKGQTVIGTCWSSEFCEKLQPAIAELEKRTGGKVDIIPAWGGFYAKIKAAPENQPPWNVLMSDPMEYSVLRDANFLLPIREENVPNIKNIFPSVRQMKYMDGYGVIVGGEPTIPMYNPHYITFKPTSWKDFLRPELKGKIAIGKDYWVENLYQAAYMLDEEEGAKEIYTDLDAVYKKAAEVARQSKLAYTSGDQIRSLIISGDVVMAPYYGCTVVAGKREGIYDGYLPKEGYTGYVAILSVVRGTQHRDLAEAWINEFLTERAQAGEVESGGGFSVNMHQKEPAWMFKEEYKDLVLITNEGWGKLLMPDYKYFRKNWDELEERYEKEVISQIGKG